MNNLTLEKQLRLWVKGISVHNDLRNECCPDFSCCQPYLLAPRLERIAFQKAYNEGNEKVKNSMLSEFLGRAFSSDKVYISGYRK